MSLRGCIFINFTRLLFPIAITVVGIEVVNAHHPVHRLEHHTAMVIGYHIGVRRQLTKSQYDVILIIL